MDNRKIIELLYENFKDCKTEYGIGDYMNIACENFEEVLNLCKAVEDVGLHIYCGSEILTTSNIDKLELAYINLSTCNYKNILFISLDHKLICDSYYEGYDDMYFIEFGGSSYQITKDNLPYANCIKYEDGINKFVKIKNKLK